MRPHFLALCFTTSIFFCQTFLARAEEPTDTRPYLAEATEILQRALSDRTAYHMLAELTHEVGPRLSGSPAAAAAVEWARQTMLKYGLDNVFLQEVMVPHWVRGEVEEAAIVNSASMGTVPLAVCALGGSVATPELGVAAEVIAVRSLEEVAGLGSAAQGKILFYNRALDPTLMDTFSAYGGAVDQRSKGAVEAAKVGAVAVLVRSMTTRLDNVPHTGGMRYEDIVPKIPAAAVSTMGAALLLHRQLHTLVRLRL